MQNDSIEGIYDTLKECAAISKSAGGIGLHIHNIRAVGSYIRGTNGTSNGIVPMLRVFNDTARYVCCRFPSQCIMPLPADARGSFSGHGLSVNFHGNCCALGTGIGYIVLLPCHTILHSG